MIPRDMTFCRSGDDLGFIERNILAFPCMICSN